MKTQSSLKKANIYRNIARYILLIATILVFVFSLLSGAEEYDGGLKGLFLNSPNALPWLVLLILTGIAWKWELAGGILIVLFGVFALFFFVVFANHFYLAVLILILLIILLGVFFIISWYLRK